MKNKTVKKIVGIATNVVLYFFLALCIFSVIFTIFSKKDADGAANLFGFQMRVVITDSMAKSENSKDVSEYDIGSLPVNSMVFVDLVPEDKDEALEWYSELEVGDVLTFRYTYSTQLTITHRITGIREKYGFVGGEQKLVGYVIDLEGDNKSSSDQHLLKQTIDTSMRESSTNYVIGRVTAKSISLGLLITLLKNPVGIVFVVIVPCVIIIFLEVLKIINAFAADKKRAERQKQEQKDSEIEELRRKLLELEMMSRNADAAKPQDTPPAEPPENSGNAEENQ